MPGRQFDDEKAARAHLEQLLHGHCRLVPEVHLRHLISNQLLRIDYAAIFPQFRHTSTAPTLIGLEVKRYFDDFREWTAALKQGIDYRHSIVEDQRSQVYRGRTPAFIFVYPDLRDLGDLAEHRSARSTWAEGAERLAGKFNVGTIRQRRDFAGHAYLEFTCAADPLWDSRYGPRRGNDWGTGRRPGAG
jgi:hypothetical protein